jgi:hypothetical protein
MVNLITRALTSTSFYICSVIGVHNHELFGAIDQDVRKNGSVTRCHNVAAIRWVTTQQQKDKFVLRGCISMPYPSYYTSPPSLIIFYRKA